MSLIVWPSPDTSICVLLLAELGVDDRVETRLQVRLDGLRVGARERTSSGVASATKKKRGNAARFWSR